MSPLRLLFFIGFLPFLLPQAWGQSAFEKSLNAFYAKKLYTVEDGLTQGYITCILEDYKGYLWLGTLNGLNRFDGKTFESFTENPNDSFSVKGQYVDQIIEDHQNRIWVLFNNGTIAVFDEQNKRFHSVVLSGYKEHQNRNFVKLYCHKGEFWIQQTHKIGRLQLHDQKEQNATWRAEVKTKIVFDEAQKEPIGIRNLNFDNQGKLWLSSINDVLIIDEPYRNADTLEARKFQLPKTLHTPDHFNLMPTNNDSLWISSWKGDLFLVVHGKVVHQTRYNSDNRHRGVMGLQKDANGIIWLQMVGPAVLYDPKTGLFHETDIKSTYLHNSRDGSLWSGTDGFGLHRISPKHSPFLNVGKDGYGLESSGEMVMGALLKSRQEDLLMLKETLRRLDKQSGKWISHSDWIEKISQTKDFKTVEAYFEDSQGRNWLASHGSVYCQEKDGRTSIYKGINNKNPGTGLFSSTCKGIYEDQEQKIWIINSGFLHAFDEELQEFIRYPYVIENPPPREDGLNTVIDYAGKLWLGTEMGLYLFDKEKHNFKRIKIDIHGNVLEDVAFSALLPHQTDSSKIWVGTKNKGLFLYDRQEETWTIWSQKNGLNNNTIYALAEDAQDRIWLSSNAGLFVYDPKKRNWMNFRKEHGVQGNEFNTRSFVKMADGRLFFGGMKGLTGFDPEEIQTQKQNHPVVLKRFAYEKRKGDSSQFLLVKDVTSKVKLAFEDSRRIEFEFAWFNYNQPENHLYSYRLSEEDPWVELQRENTLNFYNLGPGSYTLEIKAKDWLGNTNQSSLAVPFEILAPWYKTSWAIGIYSLLSLAIITFIFRIRENRKRLKVEALFSRNEAERFKELEQSKTRFFSNITHELKTPLTLVIGPLEQLYQRTKNNTDKKLIHNVKRNAADLLYLINQLLDLNKMDQGKMPIKYSQGDLALFIREIADKSQHLLDSKNINLRFQAQPASLICNFDSRKVERILINLLSNASKFSPENTTVQVRLQQSDDTIILQVEDQGPGIPTDKMESIFDQFYQLDGSDKRKYGGTGIGLALVKEYAELLEGSVSVKNNPQLGCTFSVIFPKVEVVEAPQAELEVELSEFGSAPEGFNPSENKEELEDHPVILIAEDSKELNDYLKSCLPNYTVIQAFDGKQAWELAQEKLPDLVLSDNMMPEMTGIELCTNIKDNDLTAHIPVIILTAKSALENRLEGLSVGADDYLSKPFNQDELVLRIENLIGLRRALREKYESAMQSVKLARGPLGQSPKDQAFIAKAEAIIEANLDNSNFEVSDFHQALHLSRSQAHRKIKALTNVSVSVFIRSYRLKRAMEMMQKEGLIVKEAAYRVGFSSPNYFSKCFHDQFGIPPTQVHQ